MTAQILLLGIAPERAIVISEERRGGVWVVELHGEPVADGLRPTHRRWATRASAERAAFELHAAHGIPVIQQEGGFLRPLRLIGPTRARARGPRPTLDAILDGAA